MNALYGGLTGSIEAGCAAGTEQTPVQSSLFHSILTKLAQTDLHIEVE